MRKFIPNLFLFFIVIFLCSCGNPTYYFRSNYKNANTLMHSQQDLLVKPFMKAHMKNGEICILKDKWAEDTVKGLITGYGIRYGFNRNKTFEGNISIPVDSVAIFETNTKLSKVESKRTIILSVLTGVDVAMGLICLTNPKACFGSCPTFYLSDTTNVRFADAEGFTSAISPSMEYADIDALNNKGVSGKHFSIIMKNEALETHCVNEVKLFAYPRKQGERVYQTPSDDFYLCQNTYPVSSATGNEGDITALLKNEDHQERFSLSDKNNLSSKEAIYVNFNEVKDLNDLGLIIHFRQTLMTTYLFYAAMGYMGNNVGDVFSLLETSDENRMKFDGTAKELGKIEVYSWNEKKHIWEHQDSFFEQGPIAINKQMLKLNNIASGSNVKLKLVMNKGLWRLDYLALSNIKEKVKPLEISPESILNKGKLDNSALNAILDPKSYLISMPGDEYKFNFNLPEQNNDYELFLYSKGYYLEWMRQHWIKDQNLLKLREMVVKPQKFLKREAGNYKQYEKVIEQLFWSSKIDTKTNTYREN